jgi:hypothetical protein
VHVDGAWANKQRLGDLAIRPPDRDEAKHPELTSRHAVGGSQALDCQPTLPVGCQRDADSELGLGPPIRGEVAEDGDGLSS